MMSLIFQETLEPILTNFHQQQQMRDPISPLAVPPLLLSASPIESLQRLTTPLNDPPTSESSTSTEESFLSYYTANHEESGTPTSPIDVDQLPDQLVITDNEEMGTQTNPIDQIPDRPNTPYPHTNNV
jgi:hypothetical protein